MKSLVTSNNKISYTIWNNLWNQTYLNETYLVESILSSSQD